MYIYLILIAYLFIISMIIRSNRKTHERQDTMIVVAAVTALYLICAFKKETVGIDIAGYKSVYEMTSHYNWDNYNFVYFEKGYIFLMKIFSYIGTSFQVFNAFIYAIIFIPVGIFIKRYSKNVTLSLLIYICYQLFLFNITALRQSLAISVCLLAYMMFERKNTKSYLIMIALMIFAFLLHSSSLIFIVAFFITKYDLTPFSAFIYGISGLLVIALRTNIYKLASYFNNSYGMSPKSSLGGSFLFIIVMTLFSFFSIYLIKNENSSINNSLLSSSVNNKSNIKSIYIINKEKFKKNNSLTSLPASNITDIDKVSVRMMYATCILMAVFGADIIQRSVAYYMIFIIISIPNSIEKYDLKSRFILKMCIGVFMILFFYITELAVNKFNMTPYLFYWQ